VDLIFATPPAARLIRGWRVLVEESLSDHRYIRFDLTLLRDHSSPCRRRQGTRPPRWALRKLDKEAIAEALIVQAWLDPVRPVGAEEEDAWFRGAMYKVCDASMSRTGQQPQDGRRAAYWWTPEVAGLWETSNGARRRLARHRRLRCCDPDHQEIEAALQEKCKTARGNLQRAIAQARAQA